MALPEAGGIPRLRAPPIAGSLSDFRHRRLELLLRVFRECGDIAWVRLGPMPVVVVSSAELAHAVLVERAADYGRIRLRGMFGARRLLGGGMLTTDGDVHRRQRARVAPVFGKRAVEVHAEAIVLETERRLESWPGSGEVDVAAEMTALTLRMTARSLFGFEAEDDAGRLADALAEAARLTTEEAGSLLHLPLFVPTRRNARFRRAIDAIDGAMRTAIRAHRENPPGRPDLLSMLLQAFDDAGVSPEGTALRDEAVNLFVAGFEATATTLAWACHLLAESPDGWARLTQEVDAALGDRIPSAEDVPRLPLARAALKEAMRLFPAGHVILRSTCRPTRLGAHELPAETNVMINGFAIHRRPDYFPEPERFDPSRHTEGDEARGPRRFLPFGAGPWACLGNHLSLLQGALVLARVAQRFELRRTGRPAPPVETTFAIRPRGGLPLLVERRLAPRNG